MVRKVKIMFITGTPRGPPKFEAIAAKQMRNENNHCKREHASPPPCGIKTRYKCWVQRCGDAAKLSGWVVSCCAVSCRVRFRSGREQPQQEETKQASLWDKNQIKGLGAAVRRCCEAVGLGRVVSCFVVSCRVVVSCCRVVLSCRVVSGREESPF